MSPPLIEQYGPPVPQCIAAMIKAVHPPFQDQAFVRDALSGYEALSLMARGRHIAHALSKHLPEDVPSAMAILLDSVAQPPPAALAPQGSLASFLYLPHTCFVAVHGQHHFESAMRAQHRLTQLFTAEFSMRAFLIHQPEATLARLAQWADDPSEHVRRCVSESTRPRLPWAQRVASLLQQPQKGLALLERLKDDPAVYVRRSVANHLNDVGKDHPELLVATAQRWHNEVMPTPEHRRWIVTQGLRSLVKAGHAGALAVLGCDPIAPIAPLALGQVRIEPAQARIGQQIRVSFTLHRPHQPGERGAAQRVCVDLCVHYCKARGHTHAKVFKLKTVDFAAGETLTFQKTWSLAQMSTRQHHPGVHRLEVQLNGQRVALGSFELHPPEQPG